MHRHSPWTSCFKGENTIFEKEVFLEDGSVKGKAKVMKHKNSSKWKSEIKYQGRTIQSEVHDTLEEAKSYIDIGAL